MRALVDSGCSTTVCASRLVGRCTEKGEGLVTVDGREIGCEGTKEVELTVQGTRLRLKVIVLAEVINGIDVVVGMDVISQLGGVMIRNGGVTFGKASESCSQVERGEVQCAVAVAEVGLEGSCKSAEPEGLKKLESKTAVGQKADLCKIVDKDFIAEFDGTKWVVEWFLKGESPVLKNKVGCHEHAMKEPVREEFDREVERWIAEGILVPWGKEVKSGVLPLMPVVQPTKNKVRPVLDFRELNVHVMSHTGDDAVDVCSETLREWRRMSGASTIVDLKSAYLQVHVVKKLWRYQLVNYKGKTYCLTRLGFGLSSAPKIMTRILKTVLSKGKGMEAATNSYVDDILIDETRVAVSEVVEHLKLYGLATKQPEPLEGGTALGLRLERERTGELVFRRANEVPAVREDLSRRELFSVCGKLVGHYPVAGWLRVACSYVKRRAEGVRWEDKVGKETVEMMQDIVRRVRHEDPVRGRWYAARSEKGVVWCDASSIATGVILEIGDETVEDGAWLRKKDDYNHINVAELDAVLKGVNLALKWDLRDIELRTDSATVFGWLRSAVTAENRVRVKGLSELIVKRRLGILKDLIEEFRVNLRLSFVPSEKNKADVLTRVKKAWLGVPEEASEEAMVCCTGVQSVEDLHQMHHMGVDRTLYVARKVDPAVTRDKVRRVVRHCSKCQSIDPAPVVHEAGEIRVESNWKRLAVDVTHYRQGLYLSMVDCGPGRVAIWRKLRAENAEEIAGALNEVFLERGPVDEVLIDNSTAFRSQVLKNVLDKWNISRYFRAAYRPSGNGIVERHHRTIKAMAERAQVTPMEAVFWYNMSPKSGQDETTVPQRAVFKYEWRHPSMVPKSVGGEEGGASVQIGDEVWVKPPNAKCTSQWGKGTVTDVHSQNNVSVDGMPRHILDIRRVVDSSTEDEGPVAPDGDEVVVTSGEDEEIPRRLRRERRPPVWMRDYEEGESSGEEY